MHAQLIPKQQHLSQAKELFQDSEVNITSQRWQVKLTRLAKVAIPLPHATFPAFTHNFIHKFTFLSRTTPFEEDLLQPLEDVIRAPPNDLNRELFALPPRFGGLGIVNPVSRSPKEFRASLSISPSLSLLIESQVADYPWETLTSQRGLPGCLGFDQNTPTNCVCRTHFPVEHSLSCPKGGFPSIWCQVKLRTPQNGN